MGFIDYKFLDVEMNLPIVRAETYGKLEIRTTFEFYNDIYLAFNSGKYFKMNLFSEKLFNENGIFRLETIGCENTASTDIPIFTFTFSYRLTNYFIQQTVDMKQVDKMIANLLNDMCKVCINSTFEGNEDE